MHRLLPVAVAAAMAIPPVAVVRAEQQVDLKVVRYPGSIELRLVGMGPSPDVRKIKTDNGWLIEVNTGQRRPPLGSPKFLTMPDAGMDSISFSGSGTLWRLEVNALPGKTLGSPLVTANGRDVQVSFKAQPLPEMVAGSYDLNTPGRVKRNTYVPPLRKRATAPPVGDMAIGTIAIKGNEVRMPGAGMVERLTLRNAPARDVLMTLGRAGGYNVAFYSKKTEDGQGSAGGNPISVDFQDEPIESAVNLVLTLGGLQAKRQGKTLIVGEKLPSFARQLMSRTVRLNQVSPARATEFLMSQGATFYRTKVLEEKQAEVDAVDVVGATGSQVNTGPKTELTGTSVSIQTVEADGAAAGALPLKGLTVSPDDRLNSITLTGEPNLVEIAEGYLKQVDLRKRQVAVRVQILDVDLTNAKTFDNSFAVRTGNTFIVNRSGQMLVNFGELKPPGSPETGLPGNYTAADGTPTGSPLVGSGAFQLPGGAQQFVDRPIRQYPYQGAGSRYPYGNNANTPPLQGNLYSRPGYGPYSNPGQPGVTEVELDNGNTTLNYETPLNFEYPKNQFFDYVTAQIAGGSAKILADPTLIVQESESSSVGVGRTYTTNVNSSSSSTGVISCEQEKETAGLEVDVSVARVDDNGFVTLKVNPTLSAPAGLPEQTTCNNVLYSVQNLALRELKTGEFRVRDGQTLILTGVIQDDTKEEFTKWPVLGDIPLIGQFFRKTIGTRTKRELVIVVTPQIMDDDQGGSYGYGYEPSSQDARKLIYQP
ncbi:secretin N-terminal domain-containing protein [Synechococcus sp. Minos11]|uniref:secretin N-terminal domain-containing protein n=1 Tax=Synechococcus sp. Minos11 TaxID=221341 RepID=UPI001647D6CF|nr:secretin N-terminal domain-containing protein [Synechococcus sp. Minos11]